MRGVPTKYFASDRVRRRGVGAEEATHPPEVLTRVVARYRYRWYSQSHADGLSNRLRRDARFIDRVQRRARRRFLEGEANESCRVGAVHRRPAVGAVVDVARRAALAGNGDQGRDEAVVAFA